MSEMIGKTEMNTAAAANNDTKAAKKDNGDSTAKKLFMAGLSIFAPGAACAINAGEAIKESGVLESKEFKSLVKAGEKICKFNTATALMGPIGSMLVLADEAKKEQAEEQTGKNLNSEA